jgi:hypothetical protein
VCRYEIPILMRCVPRQCFVGGGEDGGEAEGEPLVVFDTSKVQPLPAVSNTARCLDPY